MLTKKSFQRLQFKSYLNKESQSMELVNAESLRRGFTTLQMEKSLKNEGDRQNSTNRIEIML